MGILQHSIQFVLIYKDLLSLVLQVGLLLAILSLIRVGAEQARAANLQAKAALQQVRAADAQAEAAHIQSEIAKQQLKAVVGQLDTAKSQFEEQVRQGIVAIRPNFKLRDADPGFTTSPVILRNEGPGVAYRANWRFIAPENPDLLNRVSDIGTLGIGQEIAIPWGFDKEYARLQTRMLDEHGIRIECMDAAGRLYSTIAKLNQQNDFLTDSEMMMPEG